MIIPKENDSYIYFEVIKRLEAMRILDVGMHLKRIGAVSRCAMNEEVPENAFLVGVDFYPELNFPVWSNIYDRIISKDNLLGCQKEMVSQTYELTVMLGMGELTKQAAFPDIVRSICVQTRYVLSDELSEEWKRERPQLKIIDISVDRDRYYILDMGE